MKFWDTIAKMCGVEVRLHEAKPQEAEAQVGGVYVVRAATPWTVVARFNGNELSISASQSECEAMLNGRGYRLRDSTAFARRASTPRLRVGLFEIEEVAADSKVKTVTTAATWNADARPCAKPS